MRAKTSPILFALSTALIVVGCHVGIDARGLSHEDVNARRGAVDDDVLTPTVVEFFTGCLR